MGWSTELFCNITFNRETFNSKYEVEDKIKELDECIKVSANTIRDLVIMTEPDKMFKATEETDTYSALINEYETQMGLLEDYIIEKHMLSILLDKWDECHNKDGLAIDPPDNIHWNTAYLSGDFVKSVKYPTDKSIYKDIR